MKIQKDIRPGVLIDNQSTTTKTVGTEPGNIIEIQQSEVDMQQKIDDIFNAADLQISRRAARSLPKFDKLHKFKLKISWSVIGFFVFVIIAAGIMGYKTYKYAENRWPGIREEILRTYEDLQLEILNIDDNELTIDTYYKKQYMLVLDATDLREISQLGLNLENMQELQNMINNGEATSIALLEILPTEKAMQFVRIMVAEQRAQTSGELVYIEDITDEEVVLFLANIQKQQKQENESS